MTDKNGYSYIPGYSVVTDNDEWIFGDEREAQKFAATIEAEHGEKARVLFGTPIYPGDLL